jgi:UPF0755 protein
MRKSLVLAVLLLLGAAGVAGALGYRAYRSAEQPYQGYPAGESPLVSIPSGTGPQGIGQRLIAAGVVRDDWTYRVALWRSGQARRLQAGEYRFNKPVSALDAIDKIARGEVDLLPLTFREGLTAREMSRVFESAGFGTAEAFMSAVSNPAPIRTLDPDATDLEGYLFPETYSLSRDTDAPRLVALMVERFTKILTPDLQAAAQARGLSIRQLVTLASIVEKETGKPEERPIVASVYANRLRIGMPLQCDPTVIYALLLAGRYDGNLRRDDLQFDSPYNTYRYPGLPPGPVAAPGAESLRAAAQPAQTDYLYFVSRNDGSHVFSRTLGEHNRNVQTFQVEYFRQRRRQSSEKSHVPRSQVTSHQSQVASSAR